MKQYPQTHCLGGPMIQIQHLTITHTKDLRELVHDLNINIATGEKVAIIGEEGNGKSDRKSTRLNSSHMA